MEKMEYEVPSVFEELSNVDISNYIEKKNGMDYLSWATAYKLAKKEFPDISYNIIFFDGKPYLYDENLGYMVFTNVTIKGQTIDMWLPVMDGSNNAMKKEPYSIETKWGKKTIAAATMFDINKTLMRCLAKNLAMFGIGISLYAGEDLPSETNVQKQTTDTSVKEQPIQIIKCVDCGKDIKDYCDGKKTLTSKNMANLSIQKFGKALCMECITALKTKQQGDEYDKG